MERYLGLFRGKRMFFYQSSRGCPHRCAYCYNTAVNRRRWRARGADRVVDELESLRDRYDFSSVYFLDDDFFIDKKRAMDLLRRLQRFGLSFVLQGVDIRTIARLTDDELDFLERVGVERISIGVESGADRVRTEVLRKWGSSEVVRQQLARLKRRRILVLCTFMVGLPSERPDELQQTIDLALWCLKDAENLRVPQVYNFVPYPGTELHHELQLRGFDFPRGLDAWATATGITTSCRPTTRSAATSSSGPSSSASSSTARWTTTVSAVPSCAPRTSCTGR